MSATLLILAVPVSAVALLYARWEYRKRGSLTYLGLLLICVMLFVPNLALEYATTYKLPDTVAGYIGVVIGVTGIAICVVGIVQFRSVSKVFCLDAGELSVAGPYRWSRNPQYFGFWLFLLGFALIDWSAWCLPVVIVQGINLHLLVLVEEEHLRRQFGEPYREFCRRTPRYFGWGRPHAAQQK